MRISVLLPALVLTPALHASPVSTYSITDLGAGTATALNGSGGAAGWYVDPFGYTHGFVYEGATRTDLGAGTQAFAVSGNGMAYGQTYDALGDPSATQWQSGTPSALGGATSAALGVNAAGAVVGASNGTAVMFQTGGAVGIGPAAGWSAAYAINDGGAAVGTAQRASGAFGAFVFLPGIGPVWLASLGGTNSYGAAINASGAVAGTAQVSSGYLHATLWNHSSGGAQDLGTLGGVHSGAYGIGATGDVVGYSLTASGDSAAFLYTGGSMLDLNSVFDGGSDWVLEAAYAINGLGQIAGTGLYRGARHAFLLDPGVVEAQTFAAAETASAVPEPSSIVLVGLALLSLPILRRR
ncbi:MAG: hypothetical protein R2762_23400 [Bryobacteraceae bacterium]